MDMTEMHPEYPHSELTHRILRAAFDVHAELGPGLLESAYESCLHYELTSRGLTVARQLELPVVYKDMRLDVGYRIDLLVNDAIVLELKAVDKLLPIHEAQVLTYLRLSGNEVGLLLNFNTVSLKQGIKRFALTPTSSLPLSATLRTQR